MDLRVPWRVIALSSRDERRRFLEQPGLVRREAEWREEAGEGEGRRLAEERAGPEGREGVEPEVEGLRCRVSLSMEFTRGTKSNKTTLEELLIFPLENRKSFSREKCFASS